MASILFDGHRIDARAGEHLLDVLRRDREAGQQVASSCPGTGICRECIVQIAGGADGLSPMTGEEAFLAAQPADSDAPYRLACQATILNDDASIVVEAFKRTLAIATSGRAAGDAFDPWITRRGGTVYCDGEPVAEHAGPLRGIAIDVGTTTVVMHIVDLESGQTLTTAAFENPQRYGGSDVLHRIAYDAVCPGQLRETLVARLNHVLRELAIEAEDIYAVTVAANPTMRDLLFGLDVQSIGSSPFMSRTQLDQEAGRRAGTSLRATGFDLGLSMHPAGCVYGLPLISHHVGADTAAVLATLPLDHGPEPFMVIDIGTNTEVVIGHRGRLVAASCAAGPAFEGGRVRCGMSASEGAIAHCRRRDGRWEMTFIGSGPLRGVCGSGLVDLLAALRESDEMDAMGRFAHGGQSVPLSENPPLSFTRADASELALTKGAIGLGQHVLLRRLGLDASQIQRYYLAGAFANHIDLASARRIGLLVPVPDDRVERIGNAAIEGARAALLSRPCRDRIETLVRRIEHVQLEREPDFFELFARMICLEPIAA